MFGCYFDTVLLLSPARRPGRLQEEPICAEGGSRVQDKDQLQGERLVFVWTVGMETLFQLH